MTDRENIMELIKSNELQNLKEHKKLEIALNCVAFNDALYQVLENAIKLYEQNL